MIFRRMTGSRQSKSLILLFTCFGLITPQAFAYRGGGGFRGGGGGGFRGGGGMSMSRPSFGGGGGGFSRPSYGGGGGFSRPSYGGGAVSRPSYGGGNSFRPSTGYRPSTGGGQLGGAGRGEFGGGRAGGLENWGGAGSHPNFGQKPPWESGGAGRNVNGNIGNRTNIGSGNIGNRTNVGGIGDRNINNIGNRGNFNNDRININTGNINTGNIGRGNINGWGGRPGGWGYHPGYGYRPGYWGNHGAWYNGCWGWHRPIINNYYGGWGMGGFGWGMGTGLLLGGLSGWALGSSLNNWGYMPYSNPYYVPTNTVVVQQPIYVDGAAQPTYSEVNYNYAQPIDTEAPSPDQSVTDTALGTFDTARQAFMTGQYSDALSGVEQALAKLPNDAVLHEFRAVTLFALGRYADAASTLYPVLSIQPGMDWTSLSSLYPDINVFTTQLRALEAQRDAKPDDPAIRFLLGYLYSSMGFKDQAATQYEKIVALQPKDTLSAGLLKAIKGADASPTDPAKPAEGADVAAQPPAQQPAAAKNPAPAEMLSGAWTSAPGDGRSISLSFEPDSKFSWSFTPPNGKPTVFKGTYTYADGVLTLVSNQNGQVMVGRVEKMSDAEFQFLWVGAGQGEPGLDFRKG